MSKPQANLDPYTAQAESNPAPLEKIKGYREIISSVKTAMLTTRSDDGELHARAMNPANRNDDTQLNLIFLGNNVSHKFEEIQHDVHVNVNFLDQQTGSWASVCGKAKVSNDKEVIKKYWSSTTSAWFGDLKDGIHKGDETDPRVSVIEVVPDEIRYWFATKGRVGQAIDIGTHALTGKVSSPGELRTISKQEIQLAQGLN
ncbi:hypothetical protein EST38_g834 [Candolleomyces aberdarensis]|uniref:General stress protein FMN-binding split barrel domain-containing protein n=1 Tax=Candolleomyces aberdarensis TaxID=2316362 RepID=A0A4Q2DZS6_9AGAR|nr:hypothetical protein EST38_g834 [Candolleomyces aberdarensis]